MYKKRVKKALGVLLIFITVSTFVISADTLADNNTTFSNAQRFQVDWYKYESKLFSTTYSLRVHSSMSYEEISELIIMCLIKDDIIPSTVLNSNYNEEVLFIRFISMNVLIEYVGGETRNHCCGTYGFQYYLVASGAKYNANNWCIRSCKHEGIRCTNCKTIWPGGRQTITGPTGCGLHRYNEPKCGANMECVATH